MPHSATRGDASGESSQIGKLNGRPRRGVLVGCQSSVVRSEFEAINEANVVVRCQSSVVGSEKEGQSSWPPASVEPGACAADAASKR